ncbi:MAG: rhodanese-like domain-containing protein [Chitinophagales bacterium]|nr:rhodanese-like domain-containing protein [Chitinophagales bacterium]MDW8428080.1 rhodanese-like domain-containing protein [Chitinophagales bacterium]
MKALLCLLFSSVTLISAAQQAPIKYHNISSREAARLMQSSHVIVLDVRTPEEYAAGHLPKARLINFYDKDFAEQLEKLDKSKTYIVYCKAGGRSSKASQLMIEKGFTSVYNLEHGFDKWDGAIER